MNRVSFLGVSVSRDNVLKAIRNFDAAYPNTNDYNNWLDKSNYRYAIRYGGKLYPCKYIMAQAAGFQNTRSFTGGSQTNTPLRELGFEIVTK